MSARFTFIASFLWIGLANAAPLYTLVTVYDEVAINSSSSPPVINDLGQITYIRTENIGNEGNRRTVVFRDGSTLINGEQQTTTKIFGPEAGGILYRPALDDNGTLMYARRSAPDSSGGAVVFVGPPAGPFSSVSLGGVLFGEVFFSDQSFNDLGQIAFNRGNLVSVRTGSTTANLGGNAFNSIGPAINDLGSVAWGGTSAAIYLDPAGSDPAVNVALGVTPKSGANYCFALNNSDDVAYWGSDNRVYLASPTQAPLAISPALSSIIGISINDDGNVAIMTGGALYFSMNGQNAIKILGVENDLGGFDLTQLRMGTNALSNSNDVVFTINGSDIAIIHVPEVPSILLSAVAMILAGWSFAKRVRCALTRL